MEDSETRIPLGEATGAGRDSGAAMVELALVLVLLVMLLVGTVSAAVAFGRANSIQNAAREASRFGATLPGAPDAAWLDSVRDVARSAGSGDLETSVPGYLICVSFINESDEATTLTETDDSDTPSSTPCFPDSRPGEKKVQVRVQRDTAFQAILFTRDISLSAEAAARYER